MMWARRIVHVRQGESPECILACLAMIVRFHGGGARLADLRARFPALGRGGTLRDMIEIARGLELGSRAVKAEMSALEGLRLPCVIHWNFNHFVVLEKVGPKFVHIVDPAAGARKLMRDSFSRQFTGIALELIPLPPFHQSRFEGQGKTPVIILPISDYRRPIAQFIALSVLVLTFALVSPLAVQIVIDEVILKDDRDLLLVVVGAFLFANLIGALASYAQGYHVIRQTALTRMTVTHKYLDSLLSRSWAYFARRNLGSIVAQYNSLNFLVSFIVKNVGAFISDLLFVTVVSVILFLIEPRVALIVLVLNGLVVCVRLVLLNRARKLQDRDVIDRAHEEAFFVESMRGITSVKANTIELSRVAGNLDRTVRSVNTSFDLAYFGLKYSLFMQVTKAVEVIAVLYLLALDVMQARLTIGVMYAFYAYRQFLDQRLTSLVDAMGEILNLKVHRDRVVEAFDADGRVAGNLDIGRFMRLEGEIELKEVVYRIDNDRKTVLGGFSAKAPKGSFVHVTGPTGSGKTTMLKIILNIIIPHSGQVLIDGIPITSGNVSILRNSVGVVLQEDLLFRGTILENIALFDERLDIARAEECCRLCLIHDDIVELPLGYQSEVGDMGSNLSTGQQQRLLLARALYKNSAILVLDEATANLNEPVERQILENLKSLGKTVIFASHSANVGRYADSVWSLATEQGQRRDEKQGVR